MSGTVGDARKRQSEGVVGDRVSRLAEDEYVLLTVKCTERNCGTRVRYGELTDDLNTHWHIKPGVALVPAAALVAADEPVVVDVALTFDGRESICIGGDCDYRSLGKHTHRCADVLAAVERILAALLAAQPVPAPEPRGEAEVGCTCVHGPYHARGCILRDAQAGDGGGAG